MSLKSLMYCQRLAQADQLEDAIRQILPFDQRGPNDTAYEELTDTDKINFSTTTG